LSFAIEGATLECMNLKPDGLGATMARVYGEYVEMPGLQLTLEQAQRLFGLAESECGVVLESLVECHILVQLPNGKYARASGETRTRRTAATGRRSQLPRLRRHGRAGTDGHPWVG
jgi:hypothetical protein